MTLARDGGAPVRTKPFPTVSDASGRTFGSEEAEALARVIDRGTLWRVGGVEVPALEQEFARYLGVEHAAASSSGTAALHLAVAAIDPEPGDEIIVPPITDFGTVIAVLATGAVPVFADVDPVTGCLTADTVEAVISERTRAVIVVHLFGGPAGVDEIVRRCRPRGIRGRQQQYAHPARAHGEYSARAAVQPDLQRYQLPEHVSAESRSHDTLHHQKAHAGIPP